MATVSKKQELVDPAEALRLIGRLEQQARSAKTEEVRRVLLQAGCDIATVAIKTQRIVRPARKAA